MKNVQAVVLDEDVYTKQYGLKDYRDEIIIFSIDINVLNGEKELEKYKKIQ